MTVDPFMKHNLYATATGTTTELGCHSNVKTNAISHIVANVFINNREHVQCVTISELNIFVRAPTRLLFR